MTNAPGKDAYPICRCDWLLFTSSRKIREGRKAGGVSENGLRKDGEKMAKELDYAPCQRPCKQRVLKRIDEIKM
jgi:hypothetical protein